jgi:hypothetical protein
MLSLLRRSVLISSLAGLGMTAVVPVLPAAAQNVPSYAQPAGGDETIQGQIVAVDGPFHISVRDVRGFIDNVQLEHGTIINPLGLALAPGIDVTIAGFNAGSYFQANEIDAAVAYEGAPPPPVYYGPGWWYPGFAYGYGPAFSLGFVFGSARPYYVQRPFYGRPWRTGYRRGPLGGAHSVPVARTAYGTGNSGEIRRSFGADGTRVHMDQVYSGGNAPHRAEPQVYDVVRTTQAAAPARAAGSARASSGSSRH